MSNKDDNQNSKLDPLIEALNRGKSVKHDLISMSDTDLNSELLRTKKKMENYGIIISIIVQFFGAVNQLQLKTYAKWYPEYYTRNSLIFYRCFIITVISYFFIKKKNLKIPELKLINNKFWFIIRSAGAYIILLLYLSLTTYFRVSTCQCVFGCHPVIVLILSIIIIKENFYWRYAIGMIICFFGSLLMIINESKPSQREENDNKSVFIGSIIALFYLFTVSLSKFGQKMLTKDKMEPDVQSYFFGLFTGLQGLIFMIIEWNFALNFKYIMYCFVNGIVFWLNNNLTVVALKNLAISKYLPITYLATVFIFFLGWIFLGEKVYFSDIIGTLMILGFQLYNIYFPTIKVK